MEFVLWRLLTPRLSWTDVLSNTKMSRRTSSRTQKEIGSEFVMGILNEPACLLIYDLSTSLAIRSTPLLH